MKGRVPRRVVKYFKEGKKATFVPFTVEEKKICVLRGKPNRGLSSLPKGKYFASAQGKRKTQRRYERRAQEKTNFSSSAKERTSIQRKGKETTLGKFERKRKPFPTGKATSTSEGKRKLPFGLRGGGSYGDLWCEEGERGGDCKRLLKLWGKGGVTTFWGEEGSQGKKKPRKRTLSDAKKKVVVAKTKEKKKEPAPKRETYQMPLRGREGKERD